MISAAALRVKRSPRPSALTAESTRRWLFAVWLLILYAVWQAIVLSGGFPVLVYLFDNPARLGRDFNLDIQSISMVSASVYILSRGRRLEWRILQPTLVGPAATYGFRRPRLAWRAKSLSLSLRNRREISHTHAHLRYSLVNPCPLQGRKNQNFLVTSCNASR